MANENVREPGDHVAVLRSQIDEMRSNLEALGQAVRGLHLVVAELADDATMDADDTLESVDRVLKLGGFVGIGGRNLVTVTSTSSTRSKPSTLSAMSVASRSSRTCFDSFARSAMHSATSP